jgi:hypothetical protein
MNVGDLRRFIAGSHDSRAVDIVVLGAGVQSNVSLQISVPNLKIVIRVQGESQSRGESPESSEAARFLDLRFLRHFTM